MSDATAPTPEEATPPPVRVRRRRGAAEARPDRSTPSILAFCLLGVVLSLARHVPFADDPFVRGFEAVNSGRFAGIIQKNWERGGFMELKGRPLLRAWGTTSAAEGAIYANHPPLARWAEYAVCRTFGIKEWSLRAFAIACSALTAFLLCFVAGRAAGAWGAASAAVLFACMPMGFFYGRMANYESPLLALGLLATVLITSERSSFLRTLLAGLFMALATLMDWVGLFLIPAVLLAEVVVRRSRPRMSTASAVCGGALAGGAAYFAILMWWSGGVGDAWSLLMDARSQGVTQKSFEVMTFLGQQRDHLVANFGWGASCLAVLGLVWSLVGRSEQGRGARAHALAWAVVAVLNVVVFKGRSDTHDFFWYYALPAVVVVPAVLLSAIARRNGSVALVLLMALAVSTAWPIVDRHEREQTGTTAKDAQWVNNFTTEDTIVLMEGSAPAWAFYAHAWIYDDFPPTDEPILEGIKLFKEGKIPLQRVVFLMPVETQQSRPELRQALKDLGMTEHKVHGENTVLVLNR